MKEIKTIAYPVRKDLGQLIKDKTIDHQNEEKRKKEEFESNKQKLLPYVLEFVHSIYELHNMRCTKTDRLGGKYLGVLGYGKQDVNVKIAKIVNEDNLWGDCGRVFKCASTKIHMWLNCSQKFKATPNLPYSMVGTFSKQQYGESIDSEIEHLAGMIAKHYPDEWEE